MADGELLKITKGRNFRVVEAEGFGPVVFGCPPGIVKEFAGWNEPLPPHYVIPIRTFVKGRNNFDFEFIIYSFLFMKRTGQASKISIYCTEDQKARFKIILNETLFGPRFKHLLDAQFRKFCRSQKFSPKENQRFERFLEKISQDRTLYALYGRLLKNHVSDRRISIAVRNYFEEKVKQQKWLGNRKIPRLPSTLAKNYILCAQLKREMDYFGLVGEKGRDKFMEQVVDFHLFDRYNTVYIAGKNDKRKKLKVVQQNPSVFQIYSKNIEMGTVDISRLDLPEEPLTIQPIKKPFLGVTFLGIGSGFTPKRRNSCMVVWTEGRGIMVDVVPDSTNLAMKLGITEDDISYIFLTHIHSDHDAGLAEKILFGHRIRLLTTRIIFESFLRKLEAITCFPKEVIEGFVEFVEMDPHKKFKLPGFKNSFLTFDYSLHSIPAGRFTLTYRDEKGKEKKIGYSGDTKYDVQKINAWYQQGLFPEKRRDEILGFIWDADLILHDVGGGSLHTELDALEEIDNSLVKKVLLVHQHKDPAPNHKLRFAREEETCTLIKQKETVVPAILDTVRQVTLFKDLTEARLQEILRNSEVVKYRPNEVVCKQNEIGRDFYVILEGFAEVIIDGKTLSLYEKGNFFGELAINTKNPYRRATVRAKAPLKLLKIPKIYYKKFKLPHIHDKFYTLGNYFNNVIQPSLIASLAFGKIVRWERNEVIRFGEPKREVLYIILSGQVEVKNNKNKKVAFLSSGDVWGKLSNAKTHPKPDSVLASTDEVFAICLSRDEVKQVFQLYPAFYGTVYKKIKKLGGRLS